MIGILIVYKQSCLSTSTVLYVSELPAIGQFIFPLLGPFFVLHHTISPTESLLQGWIRRIGKDSLPHFKKTSWMLQTHFVL